MTTSGHRDSADPRNLADIIAMSALGADQRGVSSGATALPACMWTLACSKGVARPGGLHGSSSTQSVPCVALSDRLSRLATLTPLYRAMFWEISAIAQEKSEPRPAGLGCRRHAKIQTRPRRRARGYSAQQRGPR